MQPIKILESILAQNANQENCLFQAEDFHAIFPHFTANNLHVLLSRAEKSGILERICNGIYLYPKSKYDPTLILFKTASKIRSNCLNYISLETALSAHGIISQQLMGWLTVMTTGRRGIINCGHFGSIEFIQTKKTQNIIMPHLHLDTVSGMLWADTELALQDMKATKRPMDLVDL